MQKRYYVDTSIWRDLYENRQDRFRPLGEWAFEFFRMVRETKGIIIYSDFVVKELKCKYSDRQILEVFCAAEGCLGKALIKKESIKEAHLLSKSLGLPFGDCIHAILSRENNAVMVARDRHFWEIGHIVEVRKPEELI